MNEPKLKQHKPIDRSKKSNRRCWNCEFYPEDFSRCPKRGIVVDYWNCCKQFTWSSKKVYKEGER